MNDAYFDEAIKFSREWEEESSGKTKQEPKMPAR